MKIQIDEREIGEAVQCYLERQGVNISAYTLDYTVIAGRSDAGARVEINLTKVDAVQVAELDPVLEDSEEEETTGSPFGD